MTCFWGQGVVSPREEDMAVKIEEKNSRRLVSSYASFLFHFTSFCLFLGMFCWHFGSKAGSLPQARGFGWFSKYLTFCGFTLQLISLLFCVLSHLLPQIRTLRAYADDLSCASFVIANVVSCLYWSIFVATTRHVDKSGLKVLGLELTSPFWVTLFMHVGNAVVAWIDVLISERSFRNESFWIDVVFSVSYVLWLHICAARNKVYPYPFLNALPQPAGFIGVSLAGFTGVCFFSRIGAILARQMSPQLEKKFKSL